MFFLAHTAPKALFEKRCSRCHGLDKFTATGSPDFWKGTVKKMRDNWFSGMTDQEIKIITQDLIQNRRAKCLDFHNNWTDIFCLAWTEG
jgi:hypothetical protein